MLTTMPAQLIAGDSLSLSMPAADNPSSDDWTLALTLTPIAGGTPLSIDATDGVDEWAIALTSAQTENLSAGTHRYLIAATKAGERTTIEFGNLLVKANPAVADTDLRSPAQRALDAIDAVLEGRASASDSKHVFEDGRSIERIPHGELLTLRQHYSRIVAREQSRGRGPKRVLMRL